MSTPEFKSRVESTCLREYGVKNAGAAAEAVAKRLAITKERYGYEYALQCEEFKHKSYQTYKEHYIDDKEAAQELSERRKSTMTKLYGGDSPMTAPSIRTKIESTNMEVYGCKNPFENAAVREKFKATMRKTTALITHFSVTTLKQR